MKVLRFRPLHNVIIMCKSREKKLNAQVIQQKYLFFRILKVDKCLRFTMKDGESITLTTTKNKRKQGVSETLFSATLYYLTLQSPSHRRQKIHFRADRFGLLRENLSRV